MLTVSVPELGTPNPARLTQAPKDTPMRVLIRNVGGTTLFIAHEINALQNVNSNASTYQLTQNQSDSFVLAEGQSLFAAALGGGGSASLAISEAVPLGKIFMEN